LPCWSGGVSGRVLIEVSRRVPGDKQHEFFDVTWFVKSGSPPRGT
jgi:hypothetical protein